MTRPAAGPATQYSMKFMFLSPAVEAVIVTLPALRPVVYCATALPTALVTTELVAKVPPAPLSVKFTVTPGTPIPLASSTFATNDAGSGVFGVAVWLFPDARTIRTGGPTALVSLNIALIKPRLEQVIVTARGVGGSR